MKVKHGMLFSSWCLSAAARVFCPRNISFRLLRLLHLASIVLAEALSLDIQPSQQQLLRMPEWFCLYSLFLQDRNIKEHAALKGQEWRTPKISYVFKVLMKSYPEPCCRNIHALVKCRLDVMIICYCLSVAALTWKLGVLHLDSQSFFLPC